MKSTVLLLGAVVAAFAITTFATEPLLSPRAAGNQIKHVSAVATPTVTITYTDSTALLTPRAAGNQAKTVKGVNSDVNPAMACRKNMGGSSPKVVAECAAHTTMPCCATVAMDK